jgi:NADH:ubiquinone oxidoreductase subunit D
VVRKLKPVFGYLHRDHEKMAESASYLGSMPYTDLLDYFCSMTNNVHRKSSTSLQGRSKDFADYVSRRSNACRVVLRSARVLDVRWKRRLARSPIPTGTPNQSKRVR